MKKVGEFFEENDGAELAIDYYKEAAELYSLAKFHVNDAQKLKLKVADILSQQYQSPDKIKEAIQMYEDMGYEYLANNLTRFQGKKYFFKNILLFLLLEDTVGAEKKLEKYKDDDPSLNKSMEDRFLTSIVASFKGGDETEFGNQCYKLNQTTTMDKAQINLLAEIKKKINKKDTVNTEEFNPF